MPLGYDITTHYHQVAGTYASRRSLEASGCIPLDDQRLFYARIFPNRRVQIWRAMGDPGPGEKATFTPVYGSAPWRPNEYTAPFNKKLEALLDDKKPKQQ